MAMRPFASINAAVSFVTVVLCFYAGQYMTYFSVGLTNVHPLVNSPQLGGYDVCAQYPGVMPVGKTVKLDCENSTDLEPKRYVVVVVQLPTADSLSLCDMEVHALEG